METDKMNMMRETEGLHYQRVETLERELEELKTKHDKETREN